MGNGIFTPRLSGFSQCQMTIAGGILASILWGCAITSEYSTKKAQRYEDLCCVDTLLTHYLHIYSSCSQ